jgi:hypothetical protein
LSLFFVFFFFFFFVKVAGWMVYPAIPDSYKESLGISSGKPVAVLQKYRYEYDEIDTMPVQK